MSNFVRVIPDLRGLTKEFTYDSGSLDLNIGDVVAVPFKNRNVRAWVISKTKSPKGEYRIKQVIKKSGPPLGPYGVALAQFVSGLYGPPLRFLLKEATWRKIKDANLEKGNSLRHRNLVPIGAKQTEIVESIGQSRKNVFARMEASHCSWLVAHLIERLASRKTLCVFGNNILKEKVKRELIRMGFRVAEYPDQWSLNYEDFDIVVGCRSAVFAMPELQELDLTFCIFNSLDGLIESRKPKYSALDVMLSRFGDGELGQIYREMINNRNTAKLIVISPAPPIELTREANFAICDDLAFKYARGVEVVDLKNTDPVKGLYTSHLIGYVKRALSSAKNEPVLIIWNRLGYVNLLVCSECETDLTCNQCGNFLKINSDNSRKLRCEICSYEQYRICSCCGSKKLKTLSKGIDAIKEELENVLSLKNQIVTYKKGDKDSTTAKIIVGTHSVFTAFNKAAGVAWLNFDNEFMAPSIRNFEYSLALFFEASRIIPSGGKILVQTRFPEHELIQAYNKSDLSQAIEGELLRRNSLILPPYCVIVKIKTVLSEIDIVNVLNNMNVTPVEISQDAPNTFTIKLSCYRDMSKLVSLSEKDNSFVLEKM